MLETRNLVKIYKPKKGVPVRALDGISLKFPDKGMVFLLGKSGSGKSTLLNVLGGLDRYNEGEILIKGQSSKTFKQRHFDSYRNTYVGFIFQEYNVLDEFSVGANIALALQLQGIKPTDAQINEILREVDLVGYGNRKPNELSG
ncbi:MAG: ATP-binding cassette domain-containing protein, partial [Oscillospiraceae bacterium]|nr:ATP-binding cassette domain-containing protein [Oscillospiraceae bacterium]